MLSRFYRSTLTLDSVLEGRRVLFINAIRSDTPSGGNTSTQGMLARWRDRCSVQELSLNPAVAGSVSLSFALSTLPAALFVLWARRSGHVWLEFLLRASPWLYLRCIWARWRMRPDVVVFNHHASFLYIGAFPGCQRVLVWHDVPSLKRDGQRDISDGARCCAALERMALARSHFNATFSFDDNKRLRRLYGCRSVIIPVIDQPARARRHKAQAGRWLLIGNWTRVENCEGAQTLLLACAELLGQVTNKSLSPAVFHVAGYGSEAFISELCARHPILLNIKISVSSYYKDISDFDDAALLAPLLRGAGIKLKTIEAWAAGIPVIGTAQAFSGLPKSIWRIGGLQVKSIVEMAKICMTSSGYERDSAGIDALDGILAYEKYQAAIRGCGM
jgi:glycosyltransferase involved in cell wall biosynthesis